MKNIRNRRVVKKTVGDLKKELKDIPDDREVILAFYLKDIVLPWRHFRSSEI